MEKKEIIERMKEIYQEVSKKEDKLLEAINVEGEFLGDELRLISNLLEDYLELSEKEKYNMGESTYSYMSGEDFHGDPFSYEDLMESVQAVKGGNDLNPIIEINYKGELYE